MPTAPLPDPIPPGTPVLTPWAASADTAALVDFLENAFGARERSGRLVDAAGRIVHTEVDLGGAPLLLFDADPSWPPMPALLRLYVDRVDDVFARAIAAGARSVTEPTELSWGDRVARVRDPQGHVWWLHSRVRELDADAKRARSRDPVMIEALRYVRQSLVDALSHR